MLHDEKKAQHMQTAFSQREWDLVSLVRECEATVDCSQNDTYCLILYLHMHRGPEWAYLQL